MKHRVAGDAGIVDQDVDRPELGLDLLDALGASVVVGDAPLVDRNAGLGLEALRGLVVAGIVRGHPVARRLQRLRDRGADAAAAARHQRNPCHRFFPP